MTLLEPFLWRALLAGCIVAVTAAPLGCFVLWKRMAYFGDALSHAALLGIALGLMLGMPLQLGVAIVCAVFAASLYTLQGRKTLSGDTLLGILAHAMLAYGLVALALMPQVRIDLHSILFGDILSVRRTDLYGMAAAGAAVLALLLRYWQPLVLSTLSEDLATAEGCKTRYLHGVLLLCLTVTVALAVQVVGVLLVTSMLIIPAATARQFARSPEGMALCAALTGMLVVAAGLYASVRIDVPTGPAIVATLATVFFVVAAAGSLRRG